MRAHDTYDYAVIRVVPRVEREEFANVGIILSCERAGFLEARIELDEARLRALDPTLDLESLRRHLASIPAICRGGEAAAPIGLLPVLMSPFVGKYAHKFDLRVLAGLAFVAIGASCFMRAGFTNEVDFQHIALVQLFMGIGVALFFMPTLSILLSDLPPQQIADGSGLATFLAKP